MKAKPITYQGIQFRSKLECRHYNFMKKIGWNIEYEPEVEGVYGYQPDFELFSETEEILFEIISNINNNIGLNQLEVNLNFIAMTISLLEIKFINQEYLKKVCYL